MATKTNRRPDASIYLHGMQYTEKCTDQEMAEEDSRKVCDARPMTGGDGPNSYAKNSTVQQRRGVDAVKDLVSKAIAEKLDTDQICSTFCVADLGCSTGPNTFLAVENILEAVEFEFFQSSQIPPEFHAFFNDHTSNDFNMLFKTLPPNKRYYAAAVPGSFYGRLFPNASIHIFHSSYAIQWLSRVPEAVVDSNSPAWNKGKIHYSNSADDVIRAYETQRREDIDCFLHYRAQEIKNGGLMILTFPGRPDGVAHSQDTTNMVLQLLGSSLMDLVRKGVVTGEKVDSFNIPLYSMSSQELVSSVERNGLFTIEKLVDVRMPFPVIQDTKLVAQLIASHCRAASGGDIKEQFGEEILDELFDLLRIKCEDHASNLASGKTVANFLVVLRRKAD